jgi:uncharacterized glyoxalase superfamily protein PhnB
MKIKEMFPYLRARDANAAIDFYRAAFGATEKFRLVEPSGRVGHAELLFGESTVMISDEYPEFGIRALDPDNPGVCLIHLHVDDADAAVARAVAAGATIVREVQDAFYGERGGTVRDPFGYDWMLGHDIEEVTPEEMQRRYTAMFEAG